MPTLPRAALSSRRWGGGCATPGCGVGRAGEEQPLVRSRYQVELPLRPAALTRTRPTAAGEPFAQGFTHEALEPHVMPDAELLELAGDSPRNPGRQLDELLIGRGVEGFHAF